MESIKYIETLFGTVQVGEEFGKHLRQLHYDSLGDARFKGVKKARSDFNKYAQALGALTHAHFEVTGNGDFDLRR